MTIAIKQIDIVKRVLEEKNEKILNQLAAILDQDKGLSSEELVTKYTKPLKEGFDLEEFFAEQGEKRYDSEKITRLSREANITEPIENLLKMLD